MSHTLTIVLSDDVYDGLQRRVGAHGISRFLEDLARPHVTENLDSAYREMAADDERERDAHVLAETTVIDPADSQDASG